MIELDIEEELQIIYAEMSRWPEINKKLNHVPEHEVSRRELFFILPQLLYRIEEARKEGDKDKELFNLTIYNQTKSFVEL